MHSRNLTHLPLLLQIAGGEIPAEAYFQRRAQHRNVIKIYDVIDTEEFFVYVMERPDSCMDMFNIIVERYTRGTPLTEKEVRRYFAQIVQANISCEEKGVLHRDMKTENILVDMISDEAKLIDFGLASEVQQTPFTKFRGENDRILLYKEKTNLPFPVCIIGNSIYLISKFVKSVSCCLRGHAFALNLVPISYLLPILFLSGTPHYMPPEYIKCKQYDGCEGTVWQMGILLVDMLSPVYRAFQHPSHALSMPPKVPKDLSSGILLDYLNPDFI